MVSQETMRIVFVGVGAIGGSVGGWVAPHHADVSFVDRDPVAAALRQDGITVYQGDDPVGTRRNVRVRVVDKVTEVPDADVVVLAVKNYSLDAVAHSVRDALGDRPIVVGMQNGVENQKILPRYFSRVVYCVISYNAWMDQPGVIGYQKKGPLILGTLDNGLQTEMARLAAIFNRGVETIVTDHLQDAAHCKIVINLTNSLTTLVGHMVRPISDEGLFQHLLTTLLWEGVTILKANGHRECRLGGMPSWGVVWAGSHLPRPITRGMFRRNVKKMVLSSMAQDVIQRGAGESELESINGYMLGLADKAGLAVPYNRAVYELCRERFARAPFQPMDVTEVWQRVQARV